MKQMKLFKCNGYSVSLEDKVYSNDNVEVTDPILIQKILMQCIVKTWKINGKTIVLMSNGKLYEGLRNDKMIVPNNLAMNVDYMDTLQRKLHVPIVAVSILNNNDMIGVSNKEEQLFLLQNGKKTWHKIPVPSNVKWWYEKVRNVYEEIKKLDEPIIGINELGKAIKVNKKNPQVGILKAWHSTSRPKFGKRVQYAKIKNIYEGL